MHASREEGIDAMLCEYVLLLRLLLLLSRFTFALLVPPCCAPAGAMGYEIQKAME